MITVTKAYLPPFDEYSELLKKIWNSNQVTNHGPLALELEQQLKNFLGIKHVQLVSSGTIALQIAINSLDLTGEIITTPFSYVATTNSIIWQACKPVFVDIAHTTFGIDPDQIEAAITANTTAILATHVYGLPCNIAAIQSVAHTYNLKVIYDGAQSFGVTSHGQSVFTFGDISITSFHATKLFHTVEGGAIFTNDDDLAGKCAALKSFGIQDEQHRYAGINGKNSEFHAAMGLCLLPKVHRFIERRKEITNQYISYLRDLPLSFLAIGENITYNYAYFPVLFESEMHLLRTKNKLSTHDIKAARYFYPALNRLPYITGNPCPIAEDTSRRVLCLPLYQDLTDADVERISQLVTQSFSSTYTYA